MKAPNIEYPFEVRPLSTEEGGGYAITFPDLPGCRSDGATPEEAIKNGRDALRSWLAVAHEFGDRTPAPFSGASGRFVQRVPRSLHAELISQAKAEGVSLNTLIVALVAQGLGRRKRVARSVGRSAKSSSESRRSRRSVQPSR
jgi:antitoxin HicB